MGRREGWVGRGPSCWARRDQNYSEGGAGVCCALGPGPQGWLLRGWTWLGVSWVCAGL